MKFCAIITLLLNKSKCMDSHEYWPVKCTFISGLIKKAKPVNKRRMNDGEGAGCEK